MPSWSVQLAGPSTPSRATRSVQNCSVTKTMPRWPSLTGIALVRAWFTVGTNSSAKSGCRVLGPKPSTCSCTFRTLATLSWDGVRISSRVFVHGDSQFTWMLQTSHGFVSQLFPTTSPVCKTEIDSSQLIPANRPGLAVAKWRTKSRTDELRLQIFQEALTEPGLLEAIVLSIILLQSGHSFGDTLHSITSTGPTGTAFFSLLR